MGRGTVSADRRDAEAAQRSNGANEDAIEQLVARLTEEPAEERPGSASAPPIVQSLTAVPAGPTETTATLGTGDKKADEQPKAALTGDAKETRTAPSGEATAAPPPGTHAAKSRHAHATHRDARRSGGRRTRASHPQPDRIAGRSPSASGRGVGGDDIDVARGYGHGAYGPAPYSDVSN